MPVMDPLMSALNFTPSSTDESSATSVLTGATVEAQIVQAVQTVPAVGVTAFDAAEVGPVPTALVADTVKVYAVPFVRPEMVAVVAGGLPVTVVGVCAVVPTYGVT